MLTGTGAAHADGTLAQAAGKSTRLADFFLVVQINQHGGVKIPVADMPDYWRQQTVFLNIDTRGLHAFRQPRNRHARISHHRIRRRTQATCCPVGIVACLPQPVAIFLFGGPLKIRTATIGDNLAKQRRLLTGGGFRAMKLNEHRRFLGQIEL